MGAVKDSMVLIHLAKITLLEKSCNLFKVMIPSLVYEETIIDGKRLFKEDALLIEKFVNNGSIEVKKVSERSLIKLANEFNIFDGEAEAFALYKQEKADYLISDDYNLRKKKNIIGANIIGSLAVILKLKKDGKIDKIKFTKSMEKMRDIGWFSNVLIDKVLLEGHKNE